jgi:hypothetical protein
MKFHVGDRWADVIENQWLVTCVDGDGDCNAVRTTDGLSIWFSADDESVPLKRLISSERWIPFAEMMPEVIPADDRVVVAIGKGVVPMWSYMSDPSLPGFIAKVTQYGEYTHWRYLTPPEAP